MINLINKYCNTNLPDDPVELSRIVLSNPEDERAYELYCFYIAINANLIDWEKIEHNLPDNLRMLFIKEYNKAFLFLKVWQLLIRNQLHRSLILPDLYINLGDKSADKSYIHNLYRKLLSKQKNRLERRWQEILMLL